MDSLVDEIEDACQHSDVTVALQTSKHSCRLAVLDSITAFSDFHSSVMSEEAICGCKKPDVCSGDFGAFCLGCGRNLKADMAGGSSSKLGILEDEGDHSDKALPDLSEDEQPGHSGSNFTHKPLQSQTHIRLIRLLPNPQRYEDIDCRIVQVKLSGCISGYEALSYTWGGQTQHEFIKCGPSGRLLGVTSNCAYALRDLRLPFRERILWIDAVCINQADISERNHQVALMADIYANAKRVVIHLGPSNIIRDFFKAFKQHEGVQDAHGSSEDIVDEFLSLPWFSRVWVLQEVVMAKKAVVVIPEEELLDWNELSTGRLYLMGLKKHTPPIFTLTHADKHPLKDLASMLHMARSCKSTDPRDKIYAILGLLKSAGQLNLVADYDKAAPLLYAQFAVAVIKAYNHLDILSEVTMEPGISESLAMLPSWVPDMRIPQKLTSLAPWRTESNIPFTESPVATPLEPDDTFDDDSVLFLPFPDPWTNHPLRMPLLVRILRLDRIVDEVGLHSTGNVLAEFKLQERVQKFSLGRQVSRTHLSFSIYPPATQAHDVICAIFGASVPFVLRQLPSCEYRLVGECYLHDYSKLFPKEDYAALYTHWSRKNRLSQQPHLADVSGSGAVYTEDNLPWEEILLV